MSKVQNIIVHPCSHNKNAATTADCVNQFYVKIIGSRLEQSGLLPAEQVEVISMIVEKLQSRETGEIIKL